MKKLLLFISCSVLLWGETTPHPQYGGGAVTEPQPRCPSHFDCVPKGICGADGFIDTSGGPSLDLRSKQCNGPNICCRIPGVIYDPCPGSTVCLSQCHAGNDYPSNIDSHFINKQCLTNGQTGVCCAPPPGVCQGGTKCTDFAQCYTGYDYPSNIVQQHIGSKCYWDIVTQQQGTCCAPEVINQPSCTPDRECVRYVNCVDDFINTSGVRLIDLKTSASNCQLEFSPGYPTVCCRKPVQECFGGTICTDPHHTCNTDFISAGIDQQYLNTQCLTNGQTGVCCAPPPVVIHDVCQGGTVCTDFAQCYTGYDYPSNIVQQHIGSKCYWDPVTQQQGTCCAPEVINKPSCSFDRACVRFVNCANDEIITNGEGLIDPKTSQSNCQLELYPGYPSVCCRKPVQESCFGGTICTDPHTCNTDFISAGIDQQYTDTLCKLDSVSTGLCCAPPQPHDFCPGNTVCSDVDFCDTEYDNSINPQFLNTACYLKKGLHSKKGICCAPRNKKCPKGSECFPTWECQNGVFDISGSSLTGLKTGPEICTNPDYPGEPALCCKLPTIPPIIPNGCPGFGTCSPILKCNEGYNYHSPMDIKHVNTKCKDELTYVEGVCCARSEPDLIPYGQCGEGLTCISDSSCPAGDYSGANFQQACNVESNSNNIGTCCKNPCPSYTQCGPEFSCLSSFYTKDNRNSSVDSVWERDTWQTCSIENTVGAEGYCCTGKNIPIVPADPTQLPSPYCGTRNHNSYVDTRITSEVKNNEAEFGELPWQGILFFANYTFKCGAVLIDNQYALTAAHCVNGFGPSDFSFRIGEHQVDTFDEPRPYRDELIENIAIHPNFHPKSVFNDVAVLKLKKPIIYEYHINSICLPQPGQIIPEGKLCIASGWGKGSFQRGVYNSKPKLVTLPVVEHQRCQDLLRKTRLSKWFILDRSFMCAGGGYGEDTCTGDGGGPLACEDEAGKYFLAGITSWGIGCGGIGVPGVYANVGYAMEWINETVNNLQNLNNDQAQPSGTGGYGKK